MPVYQPFNIYREQLSSHRLGHALWDPAPNPSINDRVSIGDVGFLREGVFLRMFNVTLPHDHPSNKKIGKPDPYDPLDCGSFVNLLGSTLTKGDYPSRNVSTGENPLAATPSDFQVTYECPGIGALLSLPDDAFGQDIVRTKVFENYIRDNVASWFAWSQKNELGVEHMQDLILVTGCTLANSWAAAAFCDPTSKSKVSLSAQSHDDGRVSFTWRSAHGFVIHRNSRRELNNPQPAPNQCVFIKGFRAKRVFSRTRLIRTAAEPLLDDPDNRDEDEIQVAGVPYTRKYRDPLVAVLDYIAEQCPEGTIAIAHDDDLRLIKDVEILTADAVEKFLRENQVPVLTENSAAIVRDPEEGPRVPDEEKATFVPYSQGYGAKTLSTQPYRDHAYPPPSQSGGDASVQLSTYGPSSFHPDVRPHPYASGGGSHPLIRSRSVGKQTQKEGLANRSGRLTRATRALWSLLGRAPPDSRDLEPTQSVLSGDLRYSTRHEDSESEDEDEGEAAGATPRRRALLIGISYHRTQSKIWTPLDCPHEDVERFRKLLLETYKYAPEDITVLKDDPSLPDLAQPTRANMIRELRQLVSGAGPDDKFVFLYSGHSDQQPLYDEPEVEEDGQDEVIITCDEQRIIDNELRYILVNGLPVGCFLMAIFDTCHARSMLDLPHCYCNAVYVPWVLRGGWRTRTYNRIVRQRPSSADVLTSDDRPPSSQLLINTEIPSSVLTNQREMSVAADPHEARGRSASRLILPQVKRYSSPISLMRCHGWCGYGLNPVATVLSLSSSADLRGGWEGSWGSLTAVLCDFLKIMPCPSYYTLMSHINFQIHANCRALHEYTCYEKKKAAGGEGPGLDGELNKFQVLQLSSLAKLNMQDILLL